LPTISTVGIFLFLSPSVRPGSFPHPPLFSMYGAWSGFVSKQAPSPPPKGSWLDRVKMSDHTCFYKIRHGLFFPFLRPPLLFFCWGRRPVRFFARFSSLPVLSFFGRQPLFFLQLALFSGPRFFPYESSRPTVKNSVSWGVRIFHPTPLQKTAAFSLPSPPSNPPPPVFSALSVRGSILALPTGRGTSFPGCTLPLPPAPAIPLRPDPPLLSPSWETWEGPFFFPQIPMGEKSLVLRRFWSKAIPLPNIFFFIPFSRPAFWVQGGDYLFPPGFFRTTFRPPTFFLEACRDDISPRWLLLRGLPSSSVQSAPPLLLFAGVDETGCRYCASFFLSGIFGRSFVERLTSFFLPSANGPTRHIGLQFLFDIGLPDTLVEAMGSPPPFVPFFFFHRVGNSTRPSLRFLGRGGGPFFFLIDRRPFPP